MILCWGTFVLLPNWTIWWAGNSTLKDVCVGAGDTAWWVKAFTTEPDNPHGVKGDQIPRRRKSQLL